MNIRVAMAAVVSTAFTGCASAPGIDSEMFARSADPRSLEARLEAQSHLFEKCRRIYGHERLEGTLVLRFRVRTDGSTTLPHIFETIGQSASLDRCLTDAALRLRFDPMPAGLVADVEYPIVFRKSVRVPAAVSRK